MTNAEKKIMDYLQELSKTDNAIREALSNENKSSHKMMRYICEEARKEAENGENSCCIDDDTVYKWARHYWLDYEEKVETKKTAEETEADDEENSLFDDEQEQPKVKKVKVVRNKEKDPQEYEQMSLFDF